MGFSSRSHLFSLFHHISDISRTLVNALYEILSFLMKNVIIDGIDVIGVICFPERTHNHRKQSEIQWLTAIRWGIPFAPTLTRIRITWMALTLHPINNFLWINFIISHFFVVSVFLFVWVLLPNIDICCTPTAIQWIHGDCNRVSNIDYPSHPVVCCPMIASDTDFTRNDSHPSLS